MCVIHHEIGCLREIRSHLYHHGISDLNTPQELINFQKTYPAQRQQIIFDHTVLITEEREKLCKELPELKNTISEKKQAIETQLHSDIDILVQKLDHIPTLSNNIFFNIFNALKRSLLNFKIQNRTKLLKYRAETAIKSMVDLAHAKSDRFNFINSHFNDAVQQSSVNNILELDRRKNAIDQINSTIYGAIGEQKVVDELSKLSKDHILINDFHCYFDPPIYRRDQNAYINSVQIDHILISRGGVFLIETKNWSRDSLDNLNLFSPVQQIRRTNAALYTILNGKISGLSSPLSGHHWGDRKVAIKNLIVIIDRKPTEDFEFVRILTLNDLLRHVNYFKPIYTNAETQNIANIILASKGYTLTVKR